MYSELNCINQHDGVAACCEPKCLFCVYSSRKLFTYLARRQIDPYYVCENNNSRESFPHSFPCHVSDFSFIQFEAFNLLIPACERLQLVFSYVPNILHLILVHFSSPFIFAEHWETPSSEQYLMCAIRSLALTVEFIEMRPTKWTINPNEAISFWHFPKQLWNNTDIPLQSL